MSGLLLRWPRPHPAGRGRMAGAGKRPYLKNHTPDTLAGRRCHRTQPQAENPRSLRDSGLRNRHDELAAPVPNVSRLLHDLVLQVPRQDQQVVGPRCAYLFGREDRDVRTRKELALLVGAPVYGVSQKIGPNAAVVQQRVAFARSAVPDDGAALPLRLDQELEQATLGLLYARLKCGVVVQAPEPGSLLFRPELAHPLPDWL